MRDNRKVTSTRWQKSFLLSTLHRMLNLTTTHRQEYLFWESGNPIQKFQHTIGTKNLENTCIEEGKNSFTFTMFFTQGA